MRAQSATDVEWRLPRHPRSVGRSRALLREQAHAWKLADEATETAVLLLSELVTNSCLHARTPADRQISTRCTLRSRTLRVEVSDADAGLPLPQPCRASPDDESGRGLALVAALADSWGAHPRACGIGKTVWFELESDTAEVDFHREGSGDLHRRGERRALAVELGRGVEDGVVRPGSPSGGPAERRSGCVDSRSGCVDSAAEQGGRGGQRGQ